MAAPGSFGPPPGSAAASIKRPKAPPPSLRDVVLYAPLGLVAKLPSLLPELVQAGKSQVALARLAGRAASMKAGGGLGRQPGPVPASSSTSSTGSPAGPTASGTPPESATAAAPASATQRPAAQRPAAQRPAAKRPAAQRPAARRGGRLPIEGYDTLPASSVVALLGGLSADERALVRAHETSGRARRTILARLDQLDRG
jgi:hypothetical protein